MTHLPFTLLAYFFNALSVTADKFLLNKAIPDPLVYIFYISLFSLLALFALPYTLIPTPYTLFLASVSTLLWTMGAYFMFRALKIGQVSRVIPVIGTLIPLLLLCLAFQSITNNQLWAVLILILGMIVLTAADWQGRLTKKELVNELLSAISFTLAYTLLRQTYISSNFLSIIVWSRVILIPFVALLGFFLKKKSLSGSINTNLLSKPGLILIGGQIAGVLSEFLLLFSISLANPALVNSLQGTQYVFLFILSREKYSSLILVSKFLGIGLIAWGLYLLAF